ncbi:MAG: PAS domain-containing protein, partial [Alphaproteobacteria bacterium]
ELESTRESHDLAQRAASEILWEWSAETGMLRTSPDAWAKINLADASSEGTLEAWMEIIHPDDVGRYRSVLGAYLRGETKLYENEYRVRRTDGTYRWVHDRGLAVRDQKGQIVRMSGAVGDITDRKQAEEALKESEERYELAMRGANEGHWDWDVDHDNFFLSPRAAALIGLGEDDEFSEKLWRDRVHPDDLQPYWDTIYAHLRGETETYTNEYRVRHRDGSYRWMRERGLALRGEDGRVYRMAGSVGDVTERKKAEEALRAAMEQAELDNRSKSEFLANMSHELRTPLNAVIGFAEIMEAGLFGPLGNPQYRDYCRDIKESGDHLLSLINDILDLSKIEAGKREIDEVRIDIAKAVASCLHLVSGRAEESGVLLENAVAASLPALLADERSLRQILLNLLSNAVKFTPAGGSVTVNAAVDDAGRMIIEVADTGIGIAKRDISKVLKPFGQVASSLTRQQEGTGLGLPMAKSLVDLHGGELRIDSRKGCGTSVKIVFPRTRVAGGNNDRGHGASAA